MLEFPHVTNCTIFYPSHCIYVGGIFRRLCDWWIINIIISTCTCMLVHLHDILNAKCPCIKQLTTIDIQETADMYIAAPRVPKAATK